MPVPDPSLARPIIGIVLGYGPAPGMELIPYFLGLLAWAGLALSAVLFSPIRALIRRLRGARGSVPAEPAKGPLPQSTPEPSGDASHGRA